MENNFSPKNSTLSRLLLLAPVNKKTKTHN